MPATHSPSRVRGEIHQRADDLRPVRLRLEIVGAAEPRSSGRRSGPGPPRARPSGRSRSVRSGGGRHLVDGLRVEPERTESAGGEREPHLLDQLADRGGPLLLAAVAEPPRGARGVGRRRPRRRGTRRNRAGTGWRRSAPRPAPPGRRRGRPARRSPTPPGGSKERPRRLSSQATAVTAYFEPWEDQPPTRSEPRSATTDRSRSPSSWSRALYGPGGYFEGPPVGSDGDFVTSPHVHPVFATLLGAAVRGDARGTRSAAPLPPDRGRRRATARSPGSCSARSRTWAGRTRRSRSARRRASSLGADRGDRRCATELAPPVDVVVANELLDNLPFRDRARRS